MTAILWLRRDLRRHDLPALGAAANEGHVLPVFILDQKLLAESSVRTACILGALRSAQESYDGALVIRTGQPHEVLPELMAQVGASRVHISAEHQPYGRIRDQKVRNAGVELVATGSPYAVSPGRILNKTGSRYKVFTPFSRAWRDHGWRKPAPDVPVQWVRGVESLAIPSPPDVEVELPQMGEEAAWSRWEDFQDKLDTYHEDRDRPDLNGTSHLSVDLKFGTIHPRTLLDALDFNQEGHRTFAGELAWRDFYADVLWHEPDSLWNDLNPLPIEYEPAEGPEWEAWCAGMTGIPMVDAGMRQLNATGWMHNRVRMITASFLTKHLHIWWAHGARIFMDRLADGDPASNNHGWQWVAGTGTDAAPYFRIFNPVTQGKRFDPDGSYVRRWIPELAHLSGAVAHEPWKVLDGYLQGYPEPIVDLAREREEALRRYHATR